MQSCRPRKLCKTTNSTFYLSRSNHHKVCQLINNNYDLRKLFLNILSCLTLFYLFIKSLQITHVIISKQFITLLHLCYSPVQSTCRFFRICYNRDHQMRNPVIYAQLHNFRID